MNSENCIKAPIKVVNLLDGCKYQIYNMPNVSALCMII